MMDNCLQSMPVLRLIFISVAMPFWPFTDRNLGYRIQLIINYEALVLTETQHGKQGEIRGHTKMGSALFTSTSI